MIFNNQGGDVAVSSVCEERDVAKTILNGDKNKRVASMPVKI